MTDAIGRVCARNRLVIALVFAALAHLCPGIAAAQGQGYLINLRDTEIQAFAEQVSEITDRTLILDPAVRGQVTVFSQEPLNAEGVWQLFQSVLRVYGYAAVPSGVGWRIVPQAGVNQSALLDGQSRIGPEDFVTQLVNLRTLRAEEAVRVLRPLVAPFGYIEALNRPNAIIITDTAANARRIAELARSLDNRPGEEIGIVQLRYASARELGQTIQQILSQETPGLPTPTIAVDERSNALLIRADPGLVGEIRSIASSLDTPGGARPVTRVFRLRHSDAEAVAAILSGLAGVAAPVTNPVARALAPDAEVQDVTIISGAGAVSGPGPVGATTGAGGLAAAGAEIAIQTSAELNAVIVRAPPSVIAEMDQLIRELDVRQPQVMIEAAIVEISGDVAEALGIQFGVGDAAVPGRFAATSFSLTGLALRSILGVLGVPAAVGVAGEGLSIGFGSDNFGILVQALARSSRANLLSTPSIMTLDNRPAEIVVAQNVPFLTGTFTPSGDPGDLFSTIEREDVGIILRVLPRVHEGDVIRLEVSQEVSSLVNASVPGAVDLITNRRTIKTTVLADNGGTIVLGGLITDDRLSTESEVPVLGDIPVVGTLFSAEQQSLRKQTLFVFLRPTIVRSRVDATNVALGRYDRLRTVDPEPPTSGSLLFGEPVRTLPLEINGLY